MSTEIQSEVDRLNAVKSRIRTNLIAQGITVPSDAMLEEMATMILSVAGEDGKDGTSATHSWNGTVLTITSASGTSSADLKGAKGDKGDKGDTGDPGSQGEQGPAGPQGEPGNDYVLTDADIGTIAERAAGLVDVPEAGIPIPETAAVGQTIKVSAVDGTGKPTAWEAVDFPEGGGGDEWEVIADVTTTEEVSEITITTDSMGNAFELKKCRISAIIRATETNTEKKELQLWIGDKRYVYQADMVRSGSFSGRVELIVDNDMRSVVRHTSYHYANSTTTTFPTSQMNTVASHDIGDITVEPTPVTKITAKSTGIFGVGSRVVVLGVRE